MNHLHTRDPETSDEFCGFIAQCKIFDTAIFAAFSKMRDLSSEPGSPPVFIIALVKKINGAIFSLVSTYQLLVNEHRRSVGRSGCYGRYHLCRRIIC